MVQFKIVEITNLDGFLLEFEKVPYYSKFFFKDELEAIYSYLSDYEMDTGYNVLLSPETIYQKFNVYNDISVYNRQFGSNYESLIDIRVPGQTIIPVKGKKFIVHSY